jgi:hypothetical protein
MNSSSSPRVVIVTERASSAPPIRHPRESGDPWPMIGFNTVAVQE